ncbi:amino acid carrier protein [Glycomyces sp. NPDC047010]|uniref:alanine/glycine:cation symporter family protein n=1 Tax=Glycomyces sp. NPDC047010 TaxID=3155023 RepID=UPI00340F3082
MWGVPLIAVIFATGLILTVQLSGIQFRRLGYGLWLALRKRGEHGGEGDLSHYQALSLALAATVGVGNIGGVGAAIAIGGPGALFWMWVTGFVGMAVKYAEALLGVKYRTVNARGEQSGGPQRYLSAGIPGPVGKGLAFLFAVFGVAASFGIGNAVQAGNVTSGLDGLVPADSWWTPQLTGLVIMVLVGAVILGGVKSIGAVASALVPFMIVFYVSGCLLVLALNVTAVPAAFAEIVSQAFTGGAAVGGFAGSALLLTIQIGFARGVFSNEAGLGTGGFAAAAARTDQPVRQAMVSMTQTFIDTIIVVTMTGLVIVVTGVLGSVDADGGLVTSSALTRLAFEEGLGGPGTLGGAAGALIVAVGLATFAFATIIGWSYYGEKCLERYTGRALILPYRIVYVLVSYLGAVTSLELLWGLSDIANGLMALPNLIGLMMLTPVVYNETREFFSRPDWRLLPSEAVADAPAPVPTRRMALAEEE